MTTNLVTLDISQVADLLNRSTKSIRNYIKAGDLPAKKIHSKKGLEYVFTVDQVKAFAKKYLSLSLVVNPEMLKKESNKDSFIHDLETRKPVVRMHEGSDVRPLVDTLLRIEQDRIKVIQEYAEYKSQIAFKMGEMQSKVQHLEQTAAEKAALEAQLKEMEELYRIRDLDARQLLNYKKFHQDKKWWQFWKGTVALYDSQKLIKMTEPAVKSTGKK